MTKGELTEVEKKFAEKWSEIFNEKGNCFREPPNWDFLRELMKNIAYHEAGHFVARVFTRYQLSQIQLISIIPDRNTNGRMRCNTFFEASLDQLPYEAIRAEGLQLLLELFAGLTSEMVLNESVCNTLFDYLLEEDEEVLDSIDEEGTDLNRARKIAKILTRPYMPEERVLRLASKWTLEMLRIPEVWSAVEKVAKILLSKGEITNENEGIFDVIDNLNIYYINRIPKWRRRIFGRR